MVNNTQSNRKHALFMDSSLDATTSHLASSHSLPGHEDQVFFSVDRLKQIRGILAPS